MYVLEKTTNILTGHNATEEKEMQRCREFQHLQQMQTFLNMMNGNSNGLPSGFDSMPSGGGHGVRGNRSRTKQQQPIGTPCGRCGGKHNSDDCIWLQERKVCHECHKTGHAPSHCHSPSVDAQTCRCCGDTGHIKKGCPFNTDICARCNIKGHTVKVCRHPVGYSPVHRPPRQQQAGAQSENTHLHRRRSKQHTSRRTRRLRNGSAHLVGSPYATTPTRR